MNLNPWQYAIARGRDPYGWQIEALESFGRGYPTVLMTCNGAGKTTEVAGAAVDWFFAKHPTGQLVATSSSFNQLSNQTWPAIQTRAPREFRFTRSSPLGISTPEGGVGIGFSTKDAKRAEGWHPKISREKDPVMVLIDEGKSVPDAIWAAIDRCTVEYMLVVSSAGPPFGRFFECFHSLKKYYWTRRVPSTECPHIPDWKRNKDKEIHGEESAIYRSMHLAEFTEDGEFMVISEIALRAAIDLQPPQNTQGEVVGFFDFARGGDENVFAIRRGNTVKIVDAWRDRDTTQAVRKFKDLASQERIEGSCIWADADGLGGPMVDQLKDEGLRVNEFHGGQAPEDKDNYENLISEVWIQGVRQIERGRVHIHGMDKAAFEQLTNRKLGWGKKGKKRVESKDDMRARGVKSPDRADAILGAIMCGARMTGAMTSSSVESMVVPASPFSVPHVRF